MSDIAQLIHEKELAFTYAIVHARKVTEFNDAVMLIKGLNYRSSQEEAKAFEPVFSPLSEILMKDIVEQMATFSRYYNQFKFLETKLKSERLLKK